jgi:hypothetical protein
MAAQMTIFDVLPTRMSNAAKEKAINKAWAKMSAKERQATFEAFHAANPMVYASLVRLCYEMQNSGAGKWSIAGAFEVLRHEVLTQRRASAEDFKLNNNYKPYYSRLILSCNPELSDFFETRELEAR